VVFCILKPSAIFTTTCRGIDALIHFLNIFESTLKFKVNIYLCPVNNYNAMTGSENLTKKPLFTPFLGRRVLMGAIIALAMVGVFVIGAGPGKPEWGAYWRLKPLLLTPCLGAIVGLCYDITQPLRNINGWPGRVFLILSIVGGLIGLWMSMILGLAGTMWD